MKKLFTLILLCAAFLVKGDSWVRKADFPGGRYGPFYFSIGDKGYVGGGGSDSSFWELDPVNNVWTQKTPLPGDIRENANSFSTSKKGYVCLGQAWSGTLDELWEYDPALNQWLRKANFAGSLRHFATAFSIGNKGYVCGGADDIAPYSKLADLWQYDPATDLWSQKNGLPRTGFEFATAFSIGSSGYIVIYSSSYYIDFWEYNSLSNLWFQRAHDTVPSRYEAASFSIGNKGYLGTGQVGVASQHGGQLNDFWEYDPLLDKWSQKTNVPGSARESASFFASGNKGYIGLGADFYNSYSLSDFYEYIPDSITGINDIKSLEFCISPNPIHNHFNISFSEFIHSPSIVIFNNIGEKVFEKNVSGVVKEIPVQFSAAAGVYFLKVKEGERERVMKVAVE